MKRFNDIMDKYMKMNFFMRWLIATPILFVFTLIFLWILIGSVAPEAKIIQLSAVISGVFGLFVSLLYGLANDSQKFWDAAKNFEFNVDAISDKEELRNYFNVEFQNLKKMAGGGPHYTELNRLYAIVNTKYKYMCDTK